MFSHRPEPYYKMQDHMKVTQVCNAYVYTQTQAIKSSTQWTYFNTGSVLFGVACNKALLVAVPVISEPRLRGLW